MDATSAVNSTKNKVDHDHAFLGVYQQRGRVSKGRVGFERYRIFVPLSRVRILIPCLDWNKILLPGQMPLSHE